MKTMETEVKKTNKKITVKTVIGKVMAAVLALLMVATTGSTLIYAIMYMQAKQKKMNRKVKK